MGPQRSERAKVQVTKKKEKSVKEPEKKKRFLTRLPRVRYEIAFRNSEKGFARLMRALLKYQGRFDAQEFFSLSPRGDYIGIVELPPEFAHFVRTEAKVDLAYKSPYRLVDGSVTMRALYKSPQEELEARGKEKKADDDASGTV